MSARLHRGRRTARSWLLGALKLADLGPEDVYITQAVLFLPRTRFRATTGDCKKWKGGHPAPVVRRSFECVTRHELTGRTVIAMGNVAARACRSFGLKPAGRTSHPSRRREKPEVLMREIGAKMRRVLGMPPA